MLPQAASDYYEAQQRLVAATLALTRREWARMGDDFDLSWANVGPRVELLTASAQLGAARNGIASVPAVLSELDQMVEAEAQASARAFSGYASDGRPLDSLLYGAVVQAKTADVNSAQDRLLAGGQWLDMAVHTMVADAGRQAGQVDAFSRPRVGFVRAANPPCCQRCAVLSGKFSKSDVAFKRHPRCDCFNIATTDPASITAPIIGPDDVKDLTLAQRRAIDDGADFNQVVNAHRAGARSKNGLTTTEGVTKRGIAGKRLISASGEQGKVGRYSKAKSARLTPEGIYRIASDRDEALRLLKAHGYVL
jgi:hypothetical protein